jgi:hypothetical protein
MIQNNDAKWTYQRAIEQPEFYQSTWYQSSPHPPTPKTLAAIYLPSSAHLPPLRTAMTLEEISAKECELESRVAALDAHETFPNQQVANPTLTTPAATITDTLPPKPNLTKTTPPGPATYATFIKLHVLITLSLNEGTCYTN